MEYLSIRCLLLIFCVTAWTVSCSDGDRPEEPVPAALEEISFEELKSYTFNDLKNIENGLKNDYIGFSLGLITIVGRNAKYDGNVQMHAYKVKLRSESPKRDGSEINLSGVLLVPPLEKGAKFRYVVAPPYTYVMAYDAPTERIASGHLEPHLIFWLLMAYRNGYAVMLPDYPGFGDSFDDCYIPYLDKEAMLRTTVEYVDAAMSVLAAKGYVQSGGLIISGYSLGAYISLQLASEYETNASHGKTVDFLMTGGSPCNLLQEANLIRASVDMPQPYLFPLTLIGYKKNKHPDLVASDYLKEPYASQTDVYLDGKHDNFNDFFTKKTAEMFTGAFIRNEGMDYINKILEDNSVKPWKNKCKMVMTHGRDDETVYHKQAKDFADTVEAAGGSVDFITTAGTHTSAGLWFYLDLYSQLKRNY